MPDEVRSSSAEGESAHVVLALFASAEAAAAAADGLRAWGEADRDVRRGAFGTVRIVDGEPATTLGTSEGRGHHTRAVLRLLTRPWSSHPETSTAAQSSSGDVGELDPAVVARLHEDLARGCVALAVVCDTYEREVMRTKLELLGGEVHTLRVPTSTLVRFGDERDGDTS